MLNNSFFLLEINMKTAAKCLMVVMIAVSAAFGAETGKAAKDGAGKKPHIVQIENQPQDEAAASHEETDPIGDSKETSFGDLTNFCMGPKGNILACDAKEQVIKVVNADGKIKAKWKVGFAPYAIDCDKQGEVYVAGDKIVARLNKDGKVIKTVNAADMGFPDGKASGIAILGDDVFVAFGFGWSLRSLSSIARFDRQLNEAIVIAENLHGCCQRLDMTGRDGKLFVAENARHRVIVMDRTGKILDKWGQRDRVKIDGFGSCCNPMNLCFGEEGQLYTAESGLGRIKRYTTDGEFLGLVGYVGTARFVRAGRLAASCSNIAVGINKDASRIYVLDYDRNLIRVLKAKQDSAAAVKSDRASKDSK